MALAPARTLKRTYHCAPRSISTAATAPNGTRTRSRTPVTIGKSIGAGNDATIWTTGWSRRDQTADRPTRIPIGSVQAVASARAARVLRNVAPRAPASTTHSPEGTRVRSPTSFHAPKSAPARAARPIATRAPARTRAPPVPGLAVAAAGSGAGDGGVVPRRRRRLRRRALLRNAE